LHPERWHYVTQFAVDIIEQLDVGLNRTRVAVITWSDSAHVAFTLDRFAARQDVVQVTIRQFAVSINHPGRAGEQDPRIWSDGRYANAKFPCPQDFVTTLHSIHQNTPFQK